MLFNRDTGGDVISYMTGRRGDGQMKCSEVTKVLEGLSPREYACEWDNVGLLCGSADKEVTSIYIALDATDEVIEEAAALGADMLLTHHPLIFNGLKRVTEDDFIGRRILRLVQSDIAYYAMHTNYDVCVMADLAAEKMGLAGIEVLEETGSRDGKPCGIGVVGALTEDTAVAGELTSGISLAACAELVKTNFAVEHVKVFGNPDMALRRIALCPGSGSGVIDKAIDLGAEVLITGDIDHHDGIDAVARGLAVIDAGHYGLEHIFIPYMADYCKEHLSGVTVYQRKHVMPFLIM